MLQHNYLQGIIGCGFEVFAINVIVFLVLPEISSGIGIWLLCGVFIGQAVHDMKILCTRHCKTHKQSKGYEDIDSQHESAPKRRLVINDNDSSDNDLQINSEVKLKLKLCLTERLLRRLNKLLLIYLCKKFLAILFQLTGTFGILAWITINSQESNETPSIWLFTIIGLFSLSIVWSSPFQSYIARSVSDKKEANQTIESNSAMDMQNLQQDIKARFKSSM